MLKRMPQVLAHLIGKVVQLYPKCPSRTEIKLGLGSETPEEKTEAVQRVELYGGPAK